MAIIIILAVVAIVVLSIIFIYNKLVRQRNTVRSAWSDIDVQLKKRFNLVPNLVDIVKGYAQHEKAVFENVTKARTAAMQTQAPADKAKADNMLTQTLKSLFAVAENYPELRASENFNQLQGQLHEIENNIEAARRYYNAVVRDYNTSLEVFPSVIIANLFGFKREQFFQLESPETERQLYRTDLSEGE